MLTDLEIKQYTIVDELQLEIPQGMSVITGETGAGKSIMFDALSLCIGSRAESKAVRPGAERCDISATFAINNNPTVSTWLKNHELEVEDNICILRRTISKEGRSRSYVNGQPMPLQMTKELSQLLVNIHGQHEHQALAKRETQRRLLDNFAGHDELLTTVQSVFKEWRDCQKDIEALLASTENPAQRELLSYQVAELDALAIEEGELETIEKEHKQLTSVDDIRAACSQAKNLLRDDDARSSLLAIEQCQQQLQPFAEHFHSNSILDLLQQACICLLYTSPSPRDS